MKAIVIPHRGADTIEMIEVPRPQIDPDELLVAVHAAGVGIHDSYFLPKDAQYPYPIGIEGAGVIEEVGSAVTGYKRGDRISFVSSMQAKGGTWAQYVAVNARSLIMPIPPGLDFIQAAAIPVAGNTALKGLDALQVVPGGGTLFIAGASGAIGTIGVQIARARNWQVAGSASRANHDFLSSLGADMVVDYHDADWTDQVRQWAPNGVDCAMAIQPGTAGETMRVVKDGGRIVAISGDSVESERNIEVEMIPYQLDVRGELIQFMTDIENNALHLEVEQVYPFEDSLAALAKVQTRHARGKNVIQIR